MLDQTIILWNKLLLIVKNVSEISVNVLKRIIGKWLLEKRQNYFAY